MRYLPNQFMNISGQEASINCFDLDFQNRIITLFDEINEETANVFNSAIRALKRNSNDTITVYINSPGGSVEDGYSMLDTAKASGCNIRTVATGKAASMGAFLLTTMGTKGMRYAQPNSKILLHQPLGGAQGQASDVRIHAEHILSIRDKINDHLAKATGKKKSEIEKDTDRDYILTAEEALEYGLIDKIGDPLEEE